MTCCSCGGGRLEAILELGPQPDPDFLLERSDSRGAPEAPVELAICSTCGLVQLVGPRPDGPVPPHGHAMTVADDDPWVALLIRWCSAHVRVIVDVDGSSGLPTKSLSPEARIVADPSECEAGTADLILAGHAFAHADDIDGLVQGIAKALAPRGLVAIDFHHVLGLLQGQVDVVSHTHRSYLSLHSLESALDRHGLGVVAATRISEYGGTVRVLAANRSAGLDVDAGDFEPDEIRRAERLWLAADPAGYQGLERSVRTTCDQLVEFLDDARRAGRSVVGYGAASRGTTLLNLAGVEVDRLPLVVDRSTAKQGKLLPKAMIPVGDPAELARIRPDDIIILPWPLAGPITEQLRHASDWGASFLVAVPNLKVLR
jgi:SAM-dependent methyltransferase